MSWAKDVSGVRYVKEETLPCGQNVTRILDAAGGDIDAEIGDLVDGPDRVFASVLADITVGYMGGQGEQHHILRRERQPLFLRAR